MRSLSILVVSLALAMLAACARAPAGTFLLPASQGPAMAKQCSRHSFSTDSYWRASPRQADDFDRELRALLAQPAYKRLAKMLGPLSKYHRQLIGYTKDGRQYLYANFYPADGPLAPISGRSSENEIAVGVCDGGPSYWSATQNLQTHAIGSIGTNGSIGGGACHWNFTGPLKPSKKTACGCVGVSPLLKRPLPPLPKGLHYCPSM